MSKQYYDVDGNERTLSEMVRLEPEWAANRIRVGEVAIEMLNAVHRMVVTDSKNDHAADEVLGIMRSIMRED